MSATWLYTIWSNPRSRSRRSESCKNGRFQVYLLRQYACNQETNGECLKDTPIFFLTDFLIFVLIQRHVTFKLPPSCSLQIIYLEWMVRSTYVFDSRVRLSWLADQMALFLVRSYPRWWPWHGRTWHDMTQLKISTRAKWCCSLPNYIGTCFCHVIWS